MRFIAALLLIPAAFAQHGGGFHGGGFAPGRAPGRGFSGRGAIVHTNRGFVGRFRNGFTSSYVPFYADYGFLGASPYWDDYSYPGAYGNEPNAFFLPPPPALAAPEPAEPVRPVQPVIHEYTWPQKEGESGATATTFTIALKDGSQRFATAAWVQDGKLHYLDSEDRQQVLTPEAIDRQTTERLNQEKHLRLTLPPG